MKERLVVFACVSFLILIGVQRQANAVIHVPADQATIQAALDAATTGETVLVAPGTYFESRLDFRGKDVVLRSAGGAEQTIIDGSSAGPVFLFTSSESRAALVEGFTITHGLGSANFEGGGILITGGASPTIRKNKIIGNASAFAGGGIKVGTGSNPLIDNNEICDNTAVEQGGGVHIINASAAIVGNTVTGNEVSGVGAATPPGGGGIKATLSTAVTIINNLISMNSAPFAGGGISIFGGGAEVVSNSITANSAANGGGIHIESQVASGSDVSLLIRSNLIAQNVATENGGGIHSFMEGTNSLVDIISNDISSNMCIKAGCVDINGAGCCKGGGISAIGGLGPPGHRVHLNKIKGNTADLYGGGIFDNAAAVTVSMFLEFLDNRVEANRARFNYPGISCVDTASCVIDRSLFSTNETVPTPSDHNAIRNPGALYLKGNQSAAVVNNFFFENRGSQAGAVLLLGGATETAFRNNTLAKNITGAAGGGTVRVESAATFINNIFYGDHHAVRVSGSPGLMFATNDFFGQSVGIVVGGPTHASVSSLNSETFAFGNIAVDPAFLNITKSQYRLTPLSPLLGSVTCASTPAVDFDGDPRPVGGGCDIGADEFHIDSLGLFDAVRSKFFLRAKNSPGVADLTFQFGPSGAGRIPLTGDWNNNEVDSPGLFDPSASQYLLRNINSGGAADFVFKFGPAGAGWKPIVGDWNGDGIETVGLFDSIRGRFLLRNSNSAGAADLTFRFGPAGSGWVPIVGDWNGDRVDTIGLYDPARSRFFLRNSNSEGTADIDLRFGPAGSGWAPLAADWDGDRVDSVGLYDAARGRFLLKNEPSAGKADIDVSFGPAGSGWLPLSGKWGL